MLKKHRKTQVRMAFGPSKTSPSWAKLGLSCDLEPSYRPLEAFQDVFLSSCRHLLVFFSS